MTGGRELLERLDTLEEPEKKVFAEQAMQTLSEPAKKSVVMSSFDTLPESEKKDVASYVVQALAPPTQGAVDILLICLRDGFQNSYRQWARSYFSVLR